MENAIRHGIDPAEDGGRFDVTVRCIGARVQARVADTGIGLGAARTKPRARRSPAARVWPTCASAWRWPSEATRRYTPAAGSPRGTVATLELPATPAPGA